MKRVLEHSFVAPEYGEGGRIRDGWPTEIHRRIELYAELDVAMSVCAQGRCLAVLPDVLAAGREELKRLPMDVPLSISLYAVQRKSLGFEGRAELLIESMRAALASGTQSG